MGPRGIEGSQRYSPELLWQLPNTVVMVGLHSSGKSTFCKGELGTLGFKHISFDEEIRGLNRVGVYSDDLDMVVLINVMIQMKHAIEAGQKAVFEGANVHKGIRGVIIRGLQKAGAREIGCVWMNTPLAECLRRVERERPALRAQLMEYASVYTPPTMDEGFSMILEVPFIPKGD